MSYAISYQTCGHKPGKKSVSKNRIKKLKASSPEEARAQARAWVREMKKRDSEEEHLITAELIMADGSIEKLGLG